MGYRSYRGRRPKKAVRKWLTAILILVIICALLFGTLLGFVLAGDHDRIQGEPGAMIVLGCQVMPWGPSVLLQDRLDRALEYLELHPEIMVVVAGGQGTDEHGTEASVMADYLIQHGVNAEQILLEEKSHNTNQNLRYACQLLNEHGYDTSDDIAVVSSGFHLTRVHMLWKRLGGDYNLSLIAAPSSHIPSRIRMYIREPLALAKSFLFDRG